MYVQPFDNERKIILLQSGPVLACIVTGGKCKMYIRKKMMTESTGFTLVELAISIAIVSIVAAVAVGGYLGWKPGYDFRGAVSQVRSDLNRAKMRAVETRRQCRVVFTTNGYQIEDGNRVMNTNTWGSIDANGVLTVGTPLLGADLSDFPSVTLTLTPPPPPAVPPPSNAIVAGSEPTFVFSPRGTASPASLQVSHPDFGNATIAMSIAGRINITWP